jgi:hypothetical protein
MADNKLKTAMGVGVLGSAIEDRTKGDGGDGEYKGGESYPQDASWEGETYHGRESSSTPGGGRFASSVAKYMEEEEKFNPVGKHGRGMEHYTRPQSYKVQYS